MDINISYNLAQLHETAKFIWEKNLLVTKWPSAPKSVIDVMTEIQELMRKSVMLNAKTIIKEKKLGKNFDSEWINFEGTGGFYIIYALQEETDDIITIEVDILVDAAVSHPCPGYVLEFVGEVVDEPVATV